MHDGLPDDDARQRGRVMNKLTARKCREMFLHLFGEKRQDGITLKEDLYMQALEIALPVLEQQEMITDSQSVMTDNAEMITDSAESGDGWIEWGGGSQPVGNGRIDLKLRDGLVTRGMPAEYCEWSHDNRHTDIIAYRVIEQQEKASGKHQEGE